LWFDGQAEEAANHYISIFRDSRIVRVQRYTEAGQDIHGRDSGSVMVVEFEINGQTFVALNGGPQFKFNEAISFQVDCANQDEVDYYWDRLGEGGDETKRQCGWLADRFGLSWQVVPTELKQMLDGSNKAKADRVVVEMMKMKKLDIAALRRAYEG
jgi:predicted 3-demethylubiquinone-9 3-methyltransferase (glyoxalase superfamily)